MDVTWLTTSWSAVLMVVISTVGIYIALIILTKMAGLRSFSKMSSFDFAITIAFGALLGTTIVARKPPLAQTVVAFTVLFLLQIVVAKLRGNSTVMSILVDNKPLLLMRGTKMIEKNLIKARVTRDDLRAKLREANVSQLHQVQAVIMETTGDISVIHNDDPDQNVDDFLLKGVRGWDS